jgi:eukaryotic-like serine/threonine-protein kinase
MRAMPDDRRRDGSSETDETLTPSQAIGIEPTSASGPAGTSATSATEAAVTVSAPKGALPDRYRLGAQLGAGGMGEVLLATDRQIEREVAIKRMRVAPTRDALARFEREAKIQGRLDHPAIVPVHELATDSEGRPFFVMKRLTGTTLADMLASGTPVTRQKLLRAFADVCLAIEFAHERGVIHRDLKPANIMLGDYGEVYVLDWGVARMTSETEQEPVVADIAPGDTTPGATAVGAILGTPGYIAPELLRGERVDGRADVYALGCILFELLSGESLLPRGRAALVEALGDVDARPSHRSGGRDVPPELDALCVATTASAPDARPTARALAERIESYLDGDRDLALRKAVAARHSVVAREALAAGDSEAGRATAMREAGRAIAIDPENRDAAELVARLMLEPPRDVPREVDERVDQIERSTAREKVKLMVGVELSFFLFIPIVLLMGVRSHAAFAVFIGAIVVNIAATACWQRLGRAPSEREIYGAAVLFALLVGLMSRLYSPFLLAPAISAVSVMLFVVDPRIRWKPISLLYICAVLVPWLLEFTGVLSETTTSVGGNLLLRSELVSNRMPQSELGLAAFTIALIGISAWLAGRLAQAHRRAVRSLELQAWHLRQLVS